MCGYRDLESVGNGVEENRPTVNHDKSENPTIGNKKNILVIVNLSG